MQSIRCLIVDDEPLSQDLIASYVEMTPFLQCVGKCASARQAMEALEREPVDLMFLDIQMPGITGIDFARALRDPPRIIFSTAYENYALDGFKLDAVDYLVKPYDYAEFLRAAQKARDAIRPTAGKEPAELDFFFVKSEYRLVRIDVERILYIESMKDWAKIFLHGDPKPVITMMSLKSLQEKLPERTFMRLQRSFIVNLRFVECVERGEAVIGELRIPVADKLRPEIDRLLQEL